MRTHIFLASFITFILISSCGNYGSSSTTNVAMTSQDLFVPEAITVIPGQVLQWTNADTVVHTVIADPQTTAGGPDSDILYPDGIPAGGAYMWVVPSTAISGTTWFYHCRLHGTPGNGSSVGSGMAGVITIAAGY